MLLTRCPVRDTAGTALYFLEYDGMRHLLGRARSGEQGDTPSWLPIHSSLVPFVCGSVSGVSAIPGAVVHSLNQFQVTSWALIYPLDVYVQSWQLSLEAVVYFFLG